MVSFTARLVDSDATLAERSVVEPLVVRMASAVQQFRCSVPVYTFMPNHLHLLILGREPTSDAKSAMDRFKPRSGIWFRGHRPDLHWQENYYDHIVGHNEHPRFQIAYVANSPVRARLVDDWWEWPFTGAIGHDLRDILGGR